MRIEMQLCEAKMTQVDSQYEIIKEKKKKRQL